MSRIEDALKKASQARAVQRDVSAPHSFDAERETRGNEGYIEQETLDKVRRQHMLVSVNDMASPAAEEFRKLKQNLVRLTKKEGFYNSILITSGSVGEGKSVTATNLAISLAQEYDHTVLLVDADLRAPACHKLLSLENEYGLSNCLMDNNDVSQAMIKTGIGKLTFIPAGTPMPNPAELLASNRMANVLREMKNRYSDRYIIIDSPPVLPFAEARSLGRIADLTVLVVKEGQVSKYELQETLDALRGANIAGVVYTQATSSSSKNRFIGHANNTYHYSQN